MTTTFLTPGPIDLNALTILGVSAKPNSENPIGFFGTGAKYSIAWLLRNGGSLRLRQPTGETYEFVSAPISIRGKATNLIYLSGPNGQDKLGFTTDLGPHWEDWMVYRELASNTLDERGRIVTGEATPGPGEAAIWVEGLDEAAQRHKEIFLCSQPEAQTKYLEFHIGSNPNLYYRGVRVYREPNKLFSQTYNILAQTKLTEDRTLASGSFWELRYHLVQAAKESPTFFPQLFRALTAKPHHVEHSWSWSFAVEPSELLDYLLSIKDHPDLSHSASGWIAELAKATGNESIHELSPREAQMLRRATEFLSRAGYALQPITCVKSLGSGVLGSVKDEQILLSSSAFADGVRELVRTILEEHIHIKHSVGDCTRSMQEVLFNRIVQLESERINEIL